MTRRGAMAVACALLALVVPACSGSTDRATPTTSTGRASTPSSTGSGSAADPPDKSRPSTPTPPGAPLRWRACDGSAECAELTVPVDYARPDGPTLQLAIVRASRAKPDQRIGSLLVNPGGPGASAIETAEALSLPDGLTDRFDIVGFDPRGVGRSSPLDCRRHLQAIYDADASLDDQGDVDHYLSVSKAFVADCEAKYRDLLPHLGTVDVARDMDRVRAALGDEQVNYLGYSYGTSIGQQYARLFPTKVRTMVLDGVVDQSVSGLVAADTQAKGFEEALQAFIDYCNDEGCHRDDTGTVVDRVIAAAERAPIPAPAADRPATPGVVELGISDALYADWRWPELATALDEADRGDGSALVDLADEYLGREPDGRYANGFEIYFAASCLDSVWPRDPQAVFDAAKETGRRYPRLGEALVNDYARCALWPVPPQPLKPIPSTIKGLAPMLVISTTGDPATPYENGVKVADAVPGAVLLTYEGEGHTIFGQGQRCVDGAVADYLVTARPPAADLTC